MAPGLKTQTSAARVHVRSGLPHLSRAPLRIGRVLSGLWPGGAVLSKAARPKSAAPVSLAGFYPPAAGIRPAMAVESQTSEHQHEYFASHQNRSNHPVRPSAEAGQKN